MMALETKHVLAAGWEPSQLKTWFALADDMRANRRMWSTQHRGAVVATLFYEPSTRTRLSFETAAVRLGAAVVGAENAQENSSAKKGESLADVFRIVGGYADAIVIRHHATGEIERMAQWSPVPVISAGSGAGEHPTQALLDLYTMDREFGGINGRRICLMGDLKYGRTTHSLVKALTHFSNVSITLFSPGQLALPQSILEEAVLAGLTIRSAESFEEAVADADVVYQTRIQTERLADPAEAVEAEAFWITPDRLRLIPQSAIIMHPLPRKEEIHPSVDDDPRAAYFRQAENGLYVRMALLHTVLEQATGHEWGAQL